MKATLSRTLKLGGMGLLVALSSHNASAQLLIAADMDMATPGIQSIRSASAGEIFDVGIVFDLTSHVGGVSAYGVSARFDNTELNFSGVTPSTEMLPLGFVLNFTPGTSAEVADIGGGLGEVRTFEAATFGTGPVAGSFLAGTIKFTVPSVAVDAIPDVTLGLFNVGIDGLSANGGLPIASVTFSPGYVVPEPGETALVAGGLLLGVAAFRWSRKTRRNAA